MTMPADMPTILPYVEPAPAVPVRLPKTDVQNIARFRFPELPAQTTKPLPSEMPAVSWPESARQTATATAAVAILTQLSDNAHTVIALTSPTDGDDKTRLVIALGPQLAAHSGRSLLIVDAHGGQADLTTRLGIQRTASAGQALIYPTNIPSLHVLPASGTPMLGTFDAIRIARLRDDWPLVLLDLPSLAHEDALPLLRIADGVCLVVRLGLTPRRTVSQSTRLIRRAGSKLLGCIVVV